MSRTYALFDIDGTLMRANGASRAALEAVLGEALGVADPLARIAFWGRTDTWITAEAARRAGLPLPRNVIDDYPPLLHAMLPAYGPEALPGARSLLEALGAREDVTLLLATGNLRRTAHIKLSHVGLDRFFAGQRLGAFGDDLEDRSEMLRGLVALLPLRAGDRVVVIGDTEHDIAAAAAVDALSVAVATGPSDVEALRALGATVSLSDLADREAALSAILDGVV